jgi:hypothetical protein
VGLNSLKSLNLTNGYPNNKNNNNNNKVKSKPLELRSRVKIDIADLWVMGGEKVKPSDWLRQIIIYVDVPCAAGYSSH